MPQDFSQPLGFAEILTLYNDASERVPEVRQMSLPEFSGFLNKATRTQAFSAGLEDSTIKRASVAFDELLKPVGKVTGDIFAGIGGAISPEFREVGRAAGEQVPRGIIDFGLAGAGVATTLAGLPIVGLPLTALGAGSAAAKGYTDTGSKLVGGIQAATGVLAPGVGHLGAKFGGRLAAKALTRSSPIADRLMEFMGSESALFGMSEVVRNATSVAMGQGLSLPGSRELFENVIGLVPFLPLEVARAVRGARGRGATFADEFRIREQTRRDLEAQTAAQINKHLNTSASAIKLADPEGPSLADIPAGQKEFEFVDELFEMPSEPMEVTLAREAISPLRQRLSGQVSEAERVVLQRNLELAERTVGEFAATVEAAKRSWMGEPIPLAGKASGEATPVEGMIATAMQAIEDGVVNKGAEGKQTVGKLANEVAARAGDEPPVTDAKMKAFVEEKLSQTVEAEMAVKTSQKVENQLMKATKKLSRKEAERQSTLAWLASLQQADPEAAQLLASVIASVDQSYSGSRMSDYISRALPTVAKRFYQENQERFGAVPKPVVDLRKELRETLLATAERAQMTAVQKHTKQRELLKEELGIVDVDEVSGTLSRAGEDVTNEANSEFLQAQAETPKTVAKDSLYGPVTLDEARAAGVRSDVKFVERINQELDNVIKTGKFGAGSSKQIAAIRKIFTIRMRNRGLADFPYTKSSLGHLGENMLGRPSPETLEMSEGTLLAATREFATRHFIEQGYHPVEARDLGDVFMKVAAHFRHVDNTRIAELVSETGRSFGLTATYPEKTPSLMALNVNSMLGVRGDESIKAFFKLAAMGHELYHHQLRAWDKEGNNPGSLRGIGLAEAREWARTTDDALKRGVLRDAFEIIVPKSKLRDNEQLFDSILDAALESDDEFLSTYASLMVLGLARDSGFRAETAFELRQHLLWSDKQLSDFSRLVYTDLAAMTEAMVDLTDLSGLAKDSRGEFIRGLHTSIRRSLQTGKEVEAAVAKLQKMIEMQPENYLKLAWEGTVSRPVAEIGDALVGLPEDLHEPMLDYFRLSGLKTDQTSLKHLGKRPNWYERNLVPPAQLRELYPELQAIVDTVFRFRGRVNNFLNRSMAVFGRLNQVGKVVFDKDSPIVKVANEPRMVWGYSKAALWQNEFRRQVTPLELETIAPELTNAQRQTVYQLLQQNSAAMERVADLIVSDRRNMIGDNMSQIVMNRNKGMPATRAMVLGQELQRALFGLGENPSDPVAAATVTRIGVEVGPEAIASANEFFTAMQEPYNKLVSLLDERRGHFSPETRLGNNAVMWYDRRDKLHFVGYKKEADALAKVQELENSQDVKQGSVKWRLKSHQDRETNVLMEQIISSYSNIERKAFNRVLATIDDERQRETLAKLYVPGEAAFKERQAAGFKKHLLPRKLVAGREELNMIEGMLAYIEGVSMGLAKASTKRKAGLLLDDPKMKLNPELKRLATDYTISVVDSPSKEWSFAKKLVFHYFMGGNVSSALVELGQSFFTLSPELIRQGESVFNSYQRIGSAAQTLLSMMTGKRVPDDVSAALRQAQSEQVIDFGILQQLQDFSEESAILSLRRASQGGAPISAADLAKRPIMWYARTVEGFYRNATAFNSRLAFMAGYLTQRARSGGNIAVGSPAYQSAYEFGKRVTQNSMFGGGAAARPLIFNRLGKVYGAVGALYALRHYTTSVIAMNYRMLRDSLNTSLPKDQRVAAAKALAQMNLTTMFAAGGLGLPLAGSLVAVAEQMFPDLEIRKELREGIAALSGEDNKLGGLIADVALHGVVSPATGLDVAQRFGLGDAFGVDPNSGIGTDFFFGAPGGVVKRWVESAQGLASGEPLEVRKVLPNWAANLIKIYHDGGKIRDRRGNLIFEPTEEQNFMSAIGFKPYALGKARQSLMLQERTDEIAARKRRQFHSALADQLLTGDFRGVRQGLLDRAAADDTYSVRSGLTSVVDIAQKKSLPIDPKRTGLRASVRERENIQSLFPQVERPSEVKLYLRRKQLERSVGIPGAGVISQAELTKAQIVDRLQRQYPNLSRQRALMIAETMLRGASPLRPSGGRP